MDDFNDRAIMGDNKAPAVEALKAELIEAHHDLIARRDALADATKRVPQEVNDDEIAGRVADFVKQIQAASKVATERHKTAKEPHLTAGRVVDDFFKRQIIDALAASRATAQAPLDAFLARKAAAARKAQQEEAERARVAAEAAAAAAKTDADLDEAIRREEEAKIAASAPAPKVAEASRTRGDLGTVAGVSSKWVGEVIDFATIDLDALRPFLNQDEIRRALNAAARAGVRVVRGAKISETFQTSIR